MGLKGSKREAVCSHLFSADSSGITKLAPHIYGLLIKYVNY